MQRLYKYFQVQGEGTGQRNLFGRSQNSGLYINTVQLGRSWWEFLVCRDVALQRLYKG